MASYLSSLPSPKEFFPPTPEAYSAIYHVFKYVGTLGLVISVFPKLQAMGRTSALNSRFNLPGRYAWCLAELVGPSYMSYIVYTLPRHIEPRPDSATSYLRTGLPFWNEVLFLLYILHYLNRGVISPLFSAPSMSPIQTHIFVAMIIFQFLNGGNIGSWLVYSTIPSTTHTHSLVNDGALKGSASPFSLTSSIIPLLGLNLFTIFLYLNIQSEHHLFALRRSAAARRSRSEGKATITYNKVYVIPPLDPKSKESSWLFRRILFPHYVAEWFEWLGYWIISIGTGLSSSLPETLAGRNGRRGATGYVERGSWVGDAAGGVSSDGLRNRWAWIFNPAFWFLLNEILTMTPRAVHGRKWYEEGEE